MTYKYIAGVSELADVLCKKIEKEDYDRSWRQYEAELETRRLQWALEKNGELQVHVAPLVAEILKGPAEKRAARVEAAVTLLRHLVSRETA